MTRIRSPRELRIVVAQAPAPAGAAGARFGQLLGQARQDLAVPDRHPPADDREPDDGAGQERRDGGGDEAAPEPAGTVAAHAIPPPPPLPPGAMGGSSHGGPGRGAGRNPPARRSVAGPGRGTAPADTTRALAAQFIAHCARATEGDLVADHLAERIARFCASPALERAGGRWEVMVELDPAILPRTRLHLVLSDGTLSLRFDVGDARARQLICDNRAALHSRLEARVGAHIAVHVEVN